MAAAHPVLNSRIPQLGRALTSTEIRALRAAGVTGIPSNGYVLQAQGVDYRGAVYRPADGGMSATDIVVATKAGV
jgi:hypothetical protein